MSLVNYHTHCKYCDGVGEASEYADSAIAKGFDALGFSCHAPLPFYSDWVMERDNLPRYLSDIRSLKERYSDALEIYLGLEIDYVPEASSPALFTNAQLDYIVGSIHYTKGDRPDLYLTVDGDEEEFQENLMTNFGGDGKRLVRTYYGHMREMLENHGVDILGHMDVVKMHNRGESLFSENDDWYIEEVEGVLDAAVSNGCVIEVNTGGIARGTVAEVYPSPWIIKRCLERKIPMNVNSDAHRPDMIDAHLSQGRDVLKGCGFREVRILLGGEWRDEGL